RTSACAVLDVIELAHDIARRTAGDRREASQTFQLRPMADGTWQGLARTAGADQGGTFGDAAYGHIGDDPRSRVTIFKLFEIFGHLDDPLTDGLLLTSVRDG